MAFKFYHQLEKTDCGPSSLRMTAAYYGKEYPLAQLRDLCGVSKVGVSLFDINTGAKEIGFDTMAAQASLDDLIEKAPLPCILYWRQEHFVVLRKVIKKANKTLFHIADPSFGKLQLEASQFAENWKGSSEKGVALFLQPSKTWEEHQPEATDEGAFGLGRSLSFLVNHALKYRKGLTVVAATLGIAAGISWILPVLMQKLIDQGVIAKNMNIVYMLLLAQLGLFFGQTLLTWIRGYALVKLSLGISVDVITDFLKKLIRLPLSYFDTKLHTDILQRVDDQHNIESFISYQLIQMIFSLVTLCVMSILLFTYSYLIFVVFWAFTFLSVGWVFFFLRRRRQLDYSRFSIAADNSNALYELITGMPEIKINGAQEAKLGSWQAIQDDLYALKVNALNLNQHQVLGSGAFTQLKNIALTFLCAYWVIQGNISLGVMVSVSYIIGSLSGPVNDMVNFTRTAQDAKLSFDRMDEIQKRPDENENLAHADLGHSKDIVIKDLSFRYGKGQSPYVLKEIDITIPAGKVTAVVGASGSGKTTLMKLLLRFYEPSMGQLLYGQQDFASINSDDWRARCGVVMQNGYIYSGTVAENIAMVAHDDADPALVEKACTIACLDDFIARLPMGYKTNIGNAGVDLSGGQKQRILIARAVYRNPRYLFFDEATSALDTVIESRIVSNLDQVFSDKTVVVIAHRLSTVKNADYLIVLNEGRVAEAGGHDELVAQRGFYFNLIKNQLELGD